MLMLQKLHKLLSDIVAESIADLKKNYLLLCQLLLLSLAVWSPYIVRMYEGSIYISRIPLFLAAGFFLVGFIHPTTFFVICMLLVPIGLIYAHIEIHWGGNQIDSRIEAFLESRASEIVEYFQSHVNALDIFFILISSLLFVFLVSVVFLRSANSNPFRKRAVFALVIWTIVFLWFDLEKRVVRMPPYSFISDVVQANHRYEKLSRRQDLIGRKALQTESCGNKYDKIVVVIGESAVSDHMSAFGYHASTTPFLDESSAHLFNTLAPSNQTRFSVAMMLTDASPGNFDRFYSEHSLVGLLRACGYQTMWISNQGRFGEHESFSTSLADEANETLFLNNLSYNDAQDDGQIATELDKKGVFQRKNHVTFIHLMGSHIEYNKRYPIGFGSRNISNIIEKYDNSLLYTDTILSDLYQKFYDENMLFIYLSDHGEVVSNDRFGHGFFPAYKEEYRVPLVIWTDDSDAIKQLNSAIGNEKLNMDSFSNLVQFLVGKTKYLDISTSDMVSVLAAENVTPYRDLEAFGDPESTSKFVRPINGR